MYLFVYVVFGWNWSTINKYIQLCSLLRPSVLEIESIPVWISLFPLSLSQTVIKRMLRKTIWRTEPMKSFAAVFCWRITWKATLAYMHLGITVHERNIYEIQSLMRDIIVETVNVNNIVISINKDRASSLWMRVTVVVLKAKLEISILLKSVKLHMLFYHFCSWHN